MSKSLVPEAKNGLSKFKNEVARELGVPFSDYNGDLSSRQCGSVGGEYWIKEKRFIKKIGIIIMIIK